MLYELNVVREILKWKCTIQIAHKRGTEENGHKKAISVFTVANIKEKLWSLVINQTGGGQKKQNTVQLPYQGR